MIYPRCPVNDGRITTVFSSSHKAIDIGWHSIKHAPVCSWLDGEVVEVGGSTTSVHGLWVTIKHANSYWTRYQHLKSGSITVKVGDKLVLGQQFALRGNSGKTSTGARYGVHLHFVVYKGTLDAAGKYTHAVNPQPLTYLWPGQTINSSSMTVLPVPVPVVRNTNVNQIQVISENLRVRALPSLSGKVLGHAITGFYTVDSSTEADGYKWCSVGSDYNMAVTDGYSVDLPIDDIDSLKKEIEQLRTVNSELTTKNTELTQQVGTLETNLSGANEKIENAQKALA